MEQGFMSFLKNKQYQRKLKLVKKYQENKSFKTVPEISEPADEQQETEENSGSDSDTVLHEIEPDGEAECTEEDELVGDLDHPSAEPPSKKQKLVDIAQKIDETKVKQVENLDQVLLNPRSLRHAHGNIVTYLEGKIGNAMVESGQTFLMPDGTSRQRLGRIGASLVFV